MKNKQYAWLKILAIFLIWGLFSQAAKNTYSYLHSVVNSQGNTIRAADITDYIDVYPGKNQPLNPDSHPKNDGRKYCFDPDKGDIDLGIVINGNNKKFNELIIVENISESVMNVYWEVSGDIAPLFESTDGSFQISPSAELTAIVDPVENETAEEPESIFLTETLSEASVFINAYQEQHASVIGVTYTNTAAQVDTDTLRRSSQIENEYPLGLKLNITPDTPRGYYKGKLRIYLYNGYPSLEIPIFIIIGKDQEVKLLEPGVVDVTYPEEQKENNPSEVAPLPEESQTETPSSLEENVNDDINNVDQNKSQLEVNEELEGIDNVQKPDNNATPLPTLEPNDKQSAPDSQETVDNIAETIPEGGEER